jgi:hypothetical protein
MKSYLLFFRGGYLMADTKNRGGQKKGSQKPGQTQQKKGANTEGKGKRSQEEKRKDQVSGG